MAKAAIVIYYDLPEDVDDGYVKLQEIVGTVRHLFEDKPDVRVGIAVHESADALITLVEGGN